MPCLLKFSDPQLMWVLSHLHCISRVARCCPGRSATRGETSRCRRSPSSLIAGVGPKLLDVTRSAGKPLAPELYPPWRGFARQQAPAEGFERQAGIPHTDEEGSRDDRRRYGAAVDWGHRRQGLRLTLRRGQSVVDCPAAVLLTCGYSVTYNATCHKADGDLAGRDVPGLRLTFRQQALVPAHRAGPPRASRHIAPSYGDFLPHARGVWPCAGLSAVASRLVRCSSKRA